MSPTNDNNFGSPYVFYNSTSSTILYICVYLLPTMYIHVFQKNKMLNISKIQGLYRCVEDGGSLIVASKSFLDGATMSEMYLVHCSDLQGSQPRLVHHCGIDRGFGDHASGMVVQKYGTNGWNETRTKILSIRDSTLHDGFLHNIITVLEYK